MSNDWANQEVTVKDLNDLLLSLRQFLLKMEVDSQKILMIDHITNMLKPYDVLSFIDVQNAFLDNFGKNKLDVIEKLEKIKNININDIKSKEFRDGLTKGELAVIAQRELGISRWKLIKLNRDEMDKEIEAAFENINTLDIIGKNARRKNNNYKNP